MNVSVLEPPRTGLGMALDAGPARPLGGTGLGTVSGLDLDQVKGLLARTTDTAAAPAGPELEDVMRELSALALPPGSVVMVSLPNGVRQLHWLFATLLTGHVPALVPPSTATARWDELIAHFGPALVVGSAARLGGIAGTALELAGARAVRPASPAWLHAPGQMILLTSGTSGSATGCLHDVASLLHNAQLHAGALGVTADDTLLVTLPVHYSFALVAQVLTALRTGASLVLSRPPFSVPGYLEQLTANGITVSSLTPTLVKDLVASGAAIPRSLRVLSVGGQALPPEQTAALLAARPDRELYLTYGLTEAGPRVATLAAHQEPAHRHRSIGRPLPGVGLSLRPSPAGGQELLVASPTVYRERLGAAPAADAQRGAIIAPGVLATGDLAEIEDGYVFVRGRTTDFAVIHGEKVSLASVRRTAESLSGVVRAVTRVDPAADSYRISLFVNGYAQSLTALERQLNALLSRHERPAEVAVQPAPADMLLK